MQEIYLVNFLKQLHLTNSLIQFQTLLFLVLPVILRLYLSWNCYIFLMFLIMHRTLGILLLHCLKRVKSFLFTLSHSVLIMLQRLACDRLEFRKNTFSGVLQKSPRITKLLKLSS
ncbi:hypothetical protein V6Z11_D04G228800 [Gossypium hirsutum]